jgi:hypothetical protein
MRSELEAGMASTASPPEEIGDGAMFVVTLPRSSTGVV